MAADVEQEVLVIGGAADAADVDRIRLDDGGRDALLGEQVGGGQPSRPGADDEDFGMTHDRTSNSMSTTMAQVTFAPIHRERY